MFHLGFLEGLPKYDKKENNMEWKELEIDNLPPDILTGCGVGLQNVIYQIHIMIIKIIVV